MKCVRSEATFDGFSSHFIQSNWKSSNADYDFFFNSEILNQQWKPMKTSN